MNTSIVLLFVAALLAVFGFFASLISLIEDHGRPNKPWMHGANLFYLAAISCCVVIVARAIQFSGVFS